MLVLNAQATSYKCKNPFFIAQNVHIISWLQLTTDKINIITDRELTLNGRSSCRGSIFFFSFISRLSIKYFLISLVQILVLWSLFSIGY